LTAGITIFLIRFSYLVALLFVGSIQFYFVLHACSIADDDACLVYCEILLRSQRLILSCGRISSDQGFIKGSV